MYAQTKVTVIGQSIFKINHWHKQLASQSSDPAEVPHKWSLEKG
jgi:hypothetical protein